MSTVPEMKAQLTELERKVLRGEEQYKLAQNNVEAAQEELVAAGIELENMDAQIEGYRIKAECALAKAATMMQALQDKVLQVTVDG